MTDLYRMFDRAGRLLYVGISFNAGERATQHAETKPWWPQVDHIRIEHMNCDRTTALKREEWAIRQERPKYNKVHNNTDQYALRPIPLEPFDTPYELLSSPAWHRFKKALLHLCDSLMWKQSVDKIIDAVGYDPIGLVQSLMLSAHRSVGCPTCHQYIIPDIIRLDSHYRMSMYKHLCHTEVAAILIAYCDDCKAWIPPERTTFGMSELVDEPFNYKRTTPVDSASEKS